MPVIKNFTGRIRIINNCLGHSVRKFWSVDDLICRINEKIEEEISRRTLMDDIAKMRSAPPNGFSAPIKFCKQKNGYHYTVSDYSIDNIPLNEKDILALEFATTTLSQYKDVKILNEFVGTVDKLINIVNELKYTDHESQFSFIDFEKAPNSKGIDLLDILIDATKNRKVIKITYKKFEFTEKKHLISPYLLKEYRNRWYLLGIGIYDGNEGMRTFALDRILHVELMDKENFIEKKNFNKELYFKNTIGVNYRDDNPIEAILSFTAYEGNYIKTQYLHSSQEILVDNETELRVKLTVVQNYELESIILSYGKSVRVISPDSLREKIAKDISDSYSSYLNDSHSPTN